MRSSARQPAAGTGSEFSVASRESVDGTLLLGRIGVIALTAISLLALFVHLRHAAAAEALQLEFKRTIQAERDQLEIVVARRTEVLTSLAQHLQIAREDERQRLARNLHDELGALLTSAKLDAARIKSRLAGTMPEALERLAHLVETLNASIALGRSIIEDLRPSTLANLGLVSAIEILAREFGERSGVQVHRALAPGEVPRQRRADGLSPGPGSHHQHQQVRQGSTGLGGDGVARRPSAGLRARRRRRLRQRTQPGSAYGLVGMRFRVEAEHGKLDVVSAPGRGTTVQVRLPEAT